MKRLMSGNAALGEAAILSGCTCYFGYPITPQNELTEYMAKRMAECPGGVSSRRRARPRPSTWCSARPRRERGP